MPYHSIDNSKVNSDLLVLGGLDQTDSASLVEKVLDGDSKRSQQLLEALANFYFPNSSEVPTTSNAAKRPSK